VTRETSRRQLLKGISGIGAAGVVWGKAGVGTALAGTTAGQRAADKAARRVAGQAGRAPGSVLWRAQAGTATQLTSLDLVAGYGMVYACNTPGSGSGAGRVYAFDAGTGARAWQLSGELPQPQAAGPGAVFWITIIQAGPPAGSADIVASGAAAGSTLWSFDTGRPNSSAYYADGMVIVNDYGTVTALDAGTGRRAWTSKPTSYFAMVAAEGDTLYASGYGSAGGAAADWQLVAMNASTGAQRWRFTAFTGELFGLAAGNGVVCGTWSPPPNGPYATFTVDAFDGRRLWQADSNTAVAVQAISGGFVISLNLAALTGSRTTLYARHVSSGAPAWHRTLAANVRSLTSDGEALYTGGARDNRITALAASTGKTLWTCRMGAPAQAAAAAGDVLYVIDANAGVYAIQA